MGREESWISPPHIPLALRMPFGSLASSMTQELPAKDSSELFAPRAAFSFGLSLLLSLAVVAVMVTVDARNRQRDETREEVTAVGDQSFFKIPDTFPRPVTAAVVYHGQPLFAIYKRITDRDSTMIRVGEDDSKTYRLYVEHPSEKEKDKGNAENQKKKDATYFLKVGVDEYIELSPQQQQP